MASSNGARASSIIDWGVTARALDDEDESGDQFAVIRIGAGILVAAIDGLGHGPEVAAASRRAMAVLVLVGRCGCVQ